MKKPETNPDTEILLEASGRLGQYLQKIDKLIRQQADRTLEQAGLTIAQDAVLNYLAANAGQEINQIDIQKAFGLTNPAITKMCRRLEQKELIRIETSARDQRYKVITLTDKGTAALKAAAALKRPFEKNTLTGFSKEETKQLLSYMDRIWENISNNN